MTPDHGEQRPFQPQPSQEPGEPEQERELRNHERHKQPKPDGSAPSCAISQCLNERESYRDANDSDRDGREQRHAHGSSGGRRSARHRRPVEVIREYPWETPHPAAGTGGERRYGADTEQGDGYGKTENSAPGPTISHYPVT